MGGTTRTHSRKGFVLLLAGCGAVSDPCREAGYTGNDVELLRDVMAYARDEGASYYAALDAANYSRYSPLHGNNKHFWFHIRDVLNTRDGRRLAVG